MSTAEQEVTQVPQQAQNVTAPSVGATAPSAAAAATALQGIADSAQFQGMGKDQIMQLLSKLPQVFSQALQDVPVNKEDAAQALSNLAQAPYAIPSGAYPVGDPGPSTHPRGPPNLGQGLQSVVDTSGDKSAAAGTAGTSAPVAAGAALPQSADGAGAASSAPATTRTRNMRSAAIGSDEWSRQRKDNHKEVERRRRGNINEGINELGRIVPSGSGEKAKGAILSRAVQYIHHLKENEARNIEKWTLEKLLMDQAMGDLQAQLEEVRRMWDEEHAARLAVEKELVELKGGGKVSALASGAAPAGATASTTPASTTDKDSPKRKADEEGSGDGPDKRPRTD